MGLGYLVSGLGYLVGGLFDFSVSQSPKSLSPFRSLDLDLDLTLDLDLGLSLDNL